MLEKNRYASEFSMHVDVDFFIHAFMHLYGGEEMAC